ncbi:MAG TPA: hypothetical protein VJA21_09280 [Verrucomicrobiae bacterium]
MHAFGGVEISQDSGVSWNYSAGSPHMCVGVACSADGLKLVAIGNNLVNGIPLGISSDGGNSWQVGPIADWWHAAYSGDGSISFATAGVSIYRSKDSGASWDVINSPGAAIACSADGSRVATTTGASVYTSTDSGTTWVSNSLPALSWSSVASSADGLRLYAAATDGGIYVSQTASAAVLKLISFGNSLLIFWIVPSVDFGLQESVDLANWSGVGTAPVLNFRNLHYEVSLPAPISPRFYRLASQH